MPVPHLHISFVLIRESHAGGEELEFIENMLHDRAGHNNIHIKSPGEPLPDQCLGIALVLVP